MKSMVVRHEEIFSELHTYSSQAEAKIDYLQVKRGSFNVVDQLVKFKHIEENKITWRKLEGISRRNTCPNVIMTKR
jgi:hypothetical protein